MAEINLFKPGALNATIYLPDDWNSLHLEELHIFSRNQLSDFSLPLAGKASLLVDLIAYRAKAQRIKLPANFGGQLSQEDASASGLPLIDFLYLENNLTKQPYPKLRVPKLFNESLVGPVNDFNSMTCGEYEDCESFFYEFNENPAAKPLAHLAAILYRPAGVPYIIFNSRTCKYKTYDSDKEVKHFLKLDAWILYTIFIWYCGCRAQLPKYFPTAFEKGSDGQPDFAAFTKCIHSGAGPKNGTRDQIRTTLLKEYFFEMELEAIKAKDLKRHYESLT